MANPQPEDFPWTVLSKQVPWYGAATGYYGMLPEALREIGIACDVITPRSGLAVRLAGKCWSWLNGLPVRHQSAAFAEWSFLRRFERRRAPGLMLALEDNLPLLSLRRFARGAPRRLIGVIHYPAEFWTEAMLRNLSRLRSALVLYRADTAFFERYVGPGRVRFVPHGVDLVRFAPGEPPLSGGSAAPRFLAVGQFGRDFPLLLAVFRRLREMLPECELDIVGVHHAAAEQPVRELAALPGVTIHRQCSHEQLLELYRRTTLMLLPLRACGANNALVEALACGVPVVATDTDGVRDYGGETVFPVVPPGDAAAMAGEVIALVSDGARRRAIGFAGRQFAEGNLGWRHVALKHQEAVRGLCADEPGVGS